MSALDRFQGGQLVGRFLVGKGGVEFVLPLGLHAEADAGAGGANGLKLEHLGGHVGHGRLDPLASASPRGVRRAWQASAGSWRRRRTFAPGRFSRPARRACLAVKLQLQVFLDLPALLQQLHAAIAGDAVAEMYDQVAFVQIEEAVDRPAQPAADACAGRCTSARRKSSPLLSSTMRSGTSRKPFCSAPMEKCRRPSRASCVPAKPRPGGGPRPRSGR